jgi:anaerobic selenocysteine-containing dehydrogenase
MLVHVQDGRIRTIEADPANRATSEGVCLKGQSYVERVYSPERILTPLKRTDHGSFEAISWDEALDTIAERLYYFRDTFGPQSVLYYTGSGMKGLLNRVGPSFWRSYGGYTATYGDLCWPSGLEAARLTLGSNKHNAPWDVANARLIIFWGRNPAETSIQLMRFVEAALEQNGRLIVIDPRRTPSAERAELLVQPRPGTDGALALSIAHLLVKNDCVDHAFIEQHVLGFPEFAQMVEDWPPEKAAQITDVPERYIRRLADCIGIIQPVTICGGYGMQRYTNSSQTVRAILALLAITGNIGQPGAGWTYANLQSNIFEEVHEPVSTFPPETPDGVVRVSISKARLGQDMLAADDPPLKMMWVERANPVTQNPDTNTVLKAMRSLDFRVVVEQFLTDTAREADVVLPAKSMFEQTDIVDAYWHPYVQLRQRIIEPPGQVKPESEVYYELAHRLGISDEVIAAHIPAPSEEAIEAFLRRELTPFPGLTLEQLRQGPVMAPGAQEVSFSDFRFPTPSGKIELYSQEAKTRWDADPLPIYQEPAESVRRQGAKYPLHFMTPTTKNRIHSQFHHLQSIRQFTEPHLLMSAEDTLARGISDGDGVRVFNDRGEIFLLARLDFSLKAGCVVFPNGWWGRDGGPGNLLSCGRETDMGHGAAFHDNLVEVEKV